MALELTTSLSKKGIIVGGVLVVVISAVGLERGLSRDRSNLSDQSNVRSAIPSSLNKIPIEGRALQVSSPPLKYGTTPPLKYSIGDRLKITLFENVDVADEDQTNIPLTGLVERTELTGEYVVYETGCIVMPLLGTIEVAGKSTEELVISLQASFKGAMRRPGRASVVLTEREPVYIVGKDVRATTLKYSPGMTVLHAVALASSTKTENSDIYIRSEYSRSVERQEVATHKLKKLIALAGVLRAEQQGHAPEIPARLIELAGPQEAKKAVEMALEMRSLVLAANAPLIASYQSALAAAKQEAASHAARIALLQEHTKLHEQRREAVRLLRSHNNATAPALVAIENDVANLKDKREEAVASFSKAQDNVAQAEQKLAKIRADIKFEVQNQLTKTENEIAEEEAGLKAARRIASDFRIAAFRVGSQEQHISYQLVRRTDHGIVRSEATEITELTPGDLIQVSSAEGGSGF